MPPRKRSGPHRTAVEVTPADMKTAAEQIASVTPIKRVRKKTVPGQGQGRSTMSPAGELIEQRREKATQLRRLGMNYNQIARHMQSDGTPAVSTAYNSSRVFEDIAEWRDHVRVEAMQGVLEDDLGTLMAMQRRFLPDAMNGDPAAGNLMVKMLERRSKYLGLDSPIRHQITGADGGPIHLTAEEPGEVFNSLMADLDTLLPHVVIPQLPGTGSGDTPE